MKNNKISLFQAIRILTVSPFGGGMLFLPHVFSSLGYVTASVVVLVIFILASLSLYLLNISSTNYQKIEVNLTKSPNKYDNIKVSYPKLSKKISFKFKYFTRLALIASNTGSLIIFLNSASNILSFLIINKLGIQIIKFNYLKKFTLVFISIICFKINKISTVSTNITLSIISLSIGIYYVILMIFLGVLSKNSFSNLIPLRNKNVSKLLILLVYATHCQSGYLDITNSLSNSNLRRKNIVISGLLFTMLIYLSAGFGGYKFLNNVDINIIDYILKNDLFDLYRNSFITTVSEKTFKILLIILCMAFLFNFLINIINRINIIKPYLLNIGSSNQIITIHYCLCTLIILFELPTITIINIISTLFTNSICFGLPGLFGFYYSKRNLHKLLSLFLIVIYLINISLGIINFI
ncbi:hypothetical protein A0H76_5 [Hepatospora eriocheir]|uniref:Amino acid transporter transmembrane domain-containing protein n=1 Tax=Hepatospora eriocheir TaxID=1081669 RepID=A0A1X0QLM3_9MICR|nr:hypothetical protein A0H76_5 [Hepatospora eriocheir]